ncbi:Uncharacterised protein [Actinobaculum suis]|uniref:Uncharacterized protein n=1 Tax=Actinobaculum suis TaxID=1657 RepID=A0A0K9EV95_9ACTO|nr:hypothetical protein ACU19_00875 [Actinobaculum suis]OCA95692.1 hypothetical protein ACU20_00575 [Actinobaculum suis]OCA95894.1 hypothetical protein ACU21_00575 [Actinobaculum suis]VDG76876.1 Uncharacterised protein [Actinobaculum suis]
MCSSEQTARHSQARQFAVGMVLWNHKVEKVNTGVAFAQNAMKRKYALNKHVLKGRDETGNPAKHPDRIGGQNPCAG